MRPKFALGILVVALVAACSGGEPAGTWLYGPSFVPPTASAAASPIASAAATPASTQGLASPAASPGGSAAQVTIGTDTGADLLFDPEAATVAGGGTVQLTFENRSGLPHNLTFQAPLDAATATVVDPGASETISFEAPAPGAYPFVCTLHPGMEGTLTIEAP